MERKYFCLRATDGALPDVLLEYPDATIEWAKAYEAADGSHITAGYIYTSMPVMTYMTEEDFKNTYMIEELREQKVAEVHEVQAEKYLEIEGINNINYTKAMTTAYTEADYTAVDTYMFRKKEVRDSGNASEAHVNAIVSYADLEAYVPDVSYSITPAIEFPATTVGSFLDRFTADENVAIAELLNQDAELNRRYEALLNRTHINLTDDVLKGIMLVLNDAGVLKDSPVNETYATRVDELLRPGLPTEAYRPGLT